MSPRPGFVLEVDRSTPPTLFWHGEGFRLERLPVGSRGHLPARAARRRSPIPTRRSATRSSNPLGDSAPLSALLRAGMRLTIAFDDISLPLPPMRAPDVRQRVIEAVLDARGRGRRRRRRAHRRAGAAPPHDRRRAAPRPRRAGSSTPSRRTACSSSTTPRTPTASSTSGVTDEGEDVEINRRAAESDLLVYVNINLVAMDGGHKSVATGLASYNSIRHHHNVQHDAAQPLVHGPPPLRAAHLELADGPAHRRRR